jgi:hypothetical protein
VRLVALAIALLAPALAGAQSLIVGRGASRNSGAFIREAAAQKPIIITGTGRLELPRDSTITSTLVVIGRDTYLASTVQGNVVVVNANLFLRPGVNVAGHAVAIGGTVASTTLGKLVAASRATQTTRTTSPASWRLSLRLSPDWGEAHLSTAAASRVHGHRGAGGDQVQGSHCPWPSYDRVDGLSLPLARC